MARWVRDQAGEVSTEVLLVLPLLLVGLRGLVEGRVPYALAIVLIAVFLLWPRLW